MCGKHRFIDAMMMGFPRNRAYRRAHPGVHFRFPDAEGGGGGTGAGGAGASGEGSGEGAGGDGSGEGSEGDGSGDGSGEGEGNPPNDQTKKDEKKSKGPKKVPVDEGELTELRRKAALADKAEADRKRAADQAAKAREDATAANDGKKAVEMARARLEKDLRARDEQISTITSERDDLRMQVARMTLNYGLRDAVTEALDAKKLKLRPGAMPHLMRALAERFEVQATGENSTDMIIVERETEALASDVLPEILAGDDFKLFLGSEEQPANSNPNVGKTTTPRAQTQRPAGTAANTPPPSYAESYKQRLAETAQAGGRESVGFRRQPGAKTA